MSISFTRSTRSLKTDKFKISIGMLLLITLLFVIWGLWFFLAQITLYEVANEAELLANSEVVAYFSTTALGRIQTGQPARLRFNGFPAIQYGPVAATVTSITNKPAAGWVEVKLTLIPDSNSKIPLQRGMPGQAEIEVEHVSPLILLLRSVGYWTAPSTTSKNSVGAGP